jgi:hypothetical protein
MIKLKIDVKKIAKEHLFPGAKGTYLDLALMENKDGKGEYGDDGFIVQEVTKEKREAGVKGPIIGNWRHVEVKGRDVPASEAMKKRDNQASEPDDCDEIPFSPRHAGLPV